MIVGAYVRVSTAEQAKEGYSIGEQQVRLQKYCEAHDWKIYKIYSDPGFSGANMDRPGLKQMLMDINAGKLQKVVVYKLDRLSRSQKDTLCLIEDKFLANNVDFVSMKENFDTATPFGRAMIGILAVFAQLEREQIKERMSMGKDARAKEGKWMGGRTIPFGYDYVNDEITINDFEAMIVRMIFGLTLEEKSCYAIANILTAKGYKTRAGSEFKDRTVRRILDSKFYIGFIKYKNIWYKGQHDPIIDIDTFDQVQKILKKRYDNRILLGCNPGKATSYLGGLLRCAHCGAHYSKGAYVEYKRKKTGDVCKYPIYTCNSRYNHGKSHLVHDKNCKNKSWKVEKLDNIVFDEIKKLTFDDKKAEIKALPDNRAQIIEKEIEKIDAQIIRLMDLYQLGTIPLDKISQKSAELSEKKGDLEAELLGIKAASESKISYKQCKKLVAGFDKLLEEGSFEEIRSVITALIDHIDIDGEDISIFWNF